VPRKFVYAYRSHAVLRDPLKKERGETCDVITVRDRATLTKHLRQASGITPLRPSTKTHDHYRVITKPPTQFPAGSLNHSTYQLLTPTDGMDTTIRTQLIRQRAFAKSALTRMQTFIKTGDRKVNEIQVRFDDL